MFGRRFLRTTSGAGQMLHARQAPWPALVADDCGVKRGYGAAGILLAYGHLEEGEHPRYAAPELLEGDGLAASNAQLARQRQRCSVSA